MMKAKEVQLPDYLPSRYENWFHLYVTVLEEFKKHDIPINEETEVKLYENFTYQEVQELGLDQQEYIDFYQKFPLTIIKARALDFVMQHLPSYSQMHDIRKFVYYGCNMSLGPSDQYHKLTEGLLDISKYIKDSQQR